MGEANDHSHVMERGRSANIRGNQIDIEGTGLIAVRRTARLGSGDGTARCENVDSGSAVRRACAGNQVANIGNQDMNNEVWLKLAKRVNQVLDSPDTDGVLITHGGDTLEETSYFLDLVAKSDKPAVMVASMRPATAISADGEHESEAFDPKQGICRLRSQRKGSSLKKIDQYALDTTPTDADALIC